MKSFLSTLCILFCSTSVLLAEPISLSGTVKNSAGSPVAGATVALAAIGLTAATSETGTFSITGTGVASTPRTTSSGVHFTIIGNSVVIAPLFGSVQGTVAIFSGNGRKTASINFSGTASGRHTVALPAFAPGLSIVRITTGGNVYTQQVFSLDASRRFLGNSAANGNSFTLARQAAAAAVDTVIVSKTGYITSKTAITAYTQNSMAITLEAEGPTDMPLVYEVENTGEDCNVTTTFPTFDKLTSVTNFPDPFLMDDGTRITAKAQWACRRAEISNQIQYWEVGTKPSPDRSQVTATFASNKLTVTVKVGSQSVTLTTSISYPAGGSAPYPALITMGGSGAPSSIFSNKGCAVMSFNSSEIIANAFPGRTEKFWQLFPEDKTAGAYAGWSWAISRIIDGLQLTADQNKIDTKHLAVTGCSYMGKMALWAGAFDERIALTIPEEAGGGGEDSWRYMSSMPTASKPGATTNDHLEDIQAAQGTGWYSTRLKDFTNATISKLPIDQHSLIAMIAPRAVLVCMNADVDRGGAEAGQASMLAAAEVWKALGVPDRIGYTIPNAGGHCTWATSASNDVGGFVDKFMLGKEEAATDIKKSPYKPDMSKWITWETPELK